jgi:RNA polymerase sigma-70 factor, ECF subfamily
MIDPREDIQLSIAARAGDNKAFEALMLRYQPRVFRIVCGFLRDPSESSDVCQEVFISAYKALPRFRGDSAFYTWLYRIAVNTSKNYLIAKGRHLPSINWDKIDLDRDKFLMCNMPKEVGTPERLLMRDEMEHLVFDAIEHLPKELYKAMTLREVDGLSYEEIARRMDCPVGTVKSRLFRVRTILEQSVEPFLKQ